MITETHKRDLLLHVSSPVRVLLIQSSQCFTICHCPRTPEIDDPGIEHGPIDGLAVGIEKDKPAGLLIDKKYSL